MRERPRTPEQPNNPEEFPKQKLALLFDILQNELTTNTEGIGFDPKHTYEFSVDGHPFLVTAKCGDSGYAENILLTFHAMTDSGPAPLKQLSLEVDGMVRNIPITAATQTPEARQALHVLDVYSNTDILLSLLPEVKGGLLEQRAAQEFYEKAQGAIGKRERIFYKVYPVVLDKRVCRVAIHQDKQKGSELTLTFYETKRNHILRTLRITPDGVMTDAYTDELPPINPSVPIDADSVSYKKFEKDFSPEYAYVHSLPPQVLARRAMKEIEKAGI